MAAKPSTPAVDLTSWQKQNLVPRFSTHSEDYEFGGPAGALAVLLGLPFVVFLLYFGCGAEGGTGFCVSFSNLAQLPLEVVHGVQAGLSSGELCSWPAMLAVLGWTALQFIFYVALPGPTVNGVQLRDGTRLSYAMNGHLAFWLSLLLCCGVPMFTGTAMGSGSVQRVPLPLSWMYDHYLELLSASMVLSLAISVYSYASSFVRGVMLAEGGNTRSAIYNFFIGRPLNPRLGSLDLKACCELRPGLIGWALLNLGMAAKQIEITGQLSGSMFLVNAFQLIYVWDALYNEAAILTTMDITTDGFGFMLAFGDLTWVPFTYSLQARLLVSQEPNLSPAALLAICALNLGGYLIFRGANSQKDAFRRDPSHPSVAHLRYMETARGSRLLTSGWWGAARKINYTGDWLMGLAWSLCCGGISPLAYFYPIYFGVLLIHRAMRDDHFCAVKYGEDWSRYKQKVPALFIPGII